MAAAEISVVVPAYNEETLIQGTLEGLRSYLLTRPESFEIVVVDDGSQDDGALRSSAVAESLPVS